MTKIVGCNIGPGCIEALTARLSGRIKELKNHIMEDCILHGKGKKVSTVSYAPIIRCYDQKVKKKIIFRMAPLESQSMKIVVNKPCR